MRPFQSRIGRFYGRMVSIVDSADATNSSEFESRMGVTWNMTLFVHVENHICP